MSGICVLTRTTKRKGELYIHICTVCGEERASAYKDPTKLKAKCRLAVNTPPLPRLTPPPTIGAGTEFALLVQERYSVAPKEGCGCEAIKTIMNRAGTAWCRANIGTLCKYVQANAAHYSWLVRLLATEGKITGMLEEAISRAEAKGHTRPPLRVAFLTPGINLGGAERWVASLCRHFIPTRVCPMAVCVVEFTKADALVKSWLPPYTTCMDAAFLPQLMRHVDLLLSWGCIDLEKRVAGFADRVVDVQHGTIGFSNQKDYADCAVRARVHLTAVNDVCLLNFPPEIRSRVTVIPNGAEEDRLVSTRPPITNRPKTVLFTGRFDPVKNLDGLARAMRCLPPDWHLVAVGPPYSMPKEFPALAKEGRLTIVPAQDHLGDFFANADVYCAPSHHEAFSIAVVEAWRAGVPVVTTAYPAALAMQEKHGPMSWLVPVNPNPRVLADAILAAYAGGRTAPRVLNARCVVIENYTAVKMARRWEEYLCNLRVPVRN